MTMKYVGITVDESQLDDFYLAVGMVRGVEIIHVANARRPKPVRRPRQSRPSNTDPIVRGKLLPRGGVMSGQSIHDPRAVFKRNIRGQVVLNFEATLKNVGLNIGQLMRMKTTLGTLENSLKHSLHAKRTHQRRRARLGERRAA